MFLEDHRSEVVGAGNNLALQRAADTQKSDGTFAYRS